MAGTVPDRAFDYDNEEISIVRLLPVQSLTATAKPKAISLLTPRTHFIDLIVASAWFVDH